MKDSKKTKAIKILLVDDDSLFRQSIEIVLRKNGYKVYSAGGLKQALEILKDGDINLIITDLKMNDGDGIELLTKAKELQPRIEVIILRRLGLHF